MDDPVFIPFLISIPIGIIVAFVYLKAKVRYEERAKERTEVRVRAEEIAKEVEEHKWNGCQCEKCGKIRDNGHRWNFYILCGECVKEC